MKTEYIREAVVNYKKGKKVSEKITVTESSIVADFFRKILPDNSREHVMALYLDGSHSIIAYSIVSTGTANSCPLHPREVFQRSVLVGAVAVMLSHNHPSGSLKPSKEDLSITKKIRESANVLGITFLDHIILNEDSHYSLFEQGDL